MYYTIYKIINIINQKFYIGMHQTKELNDGYMGSGKLIQRAINKHGLENFKKEILFVFDNEKDMIEKEKELVIVSEETYNICPGGKGGFGYINENNLRISVEQLNIARKEKLNSNSEFKEIMRQGCIKGGNASAAYIMSLTKEEKKKYASNRLPEKHKQETKEKISKANKGKIPWNKGIPRTEEEKLKISQTLLKRNKIGINNG